MNFLGEIVLSLGVDKRRYEVGEAPKYIVQAGIPGSNVYWTSFKNGIATGEQNADYGQVIGANGTAELVGGPWTDADVGNWEKQALVVTPDGAQQQLVQTFFSVVPKATAAATTTPVPINSTPDWLAGDTTIFGAAIPLPPVVVFGGLALLAYSLFKGKR